MKKRIITSFLLIALLNLIGCYSVNYLTVPEYQKNERDKGKPSEIIIKVKDSQGYLFTDSNFYIENDTLYGKGEVVNNEGKKPFEGEIALSEIESIEVENINWLNTSLLGLGVLTIGVIGLVVLFALLTSGGFN
jgi:hypothetical protein